MYFTWFEIVIVIIIIVNYYESNAVANHPQQRVNLSYSGPGLHLQPAAAERTSLIPGGSQAMCKETSFLLKQL